MTTSDVHPPPTTAFEPAPVPAGPDLRSTTQAPVPFYAHPCTFDYYNSTDPNLYSLNNPRAFTSTVRPYTYASSSSSSNATTASSGSLGSVSSTGSNYSSSSIFSAASSSASSSSSSLGNTGELLQADDKPCEKYRQFMHSSKQERTVVIGKLVDVSAEIIDSIWHPRFLQDSQRQAKIMSTRNFIHEILKRSKTTYSTLQISLFYLFRVKKVVHERLVRRNTVLPPTPPSSQSSDEDDDQPVRKRQVSERLDDIMCCGRRMFLASLMVSSKYLHDKNYRNRAWAKISGLDIDEINAAELAFLRLIDYKLYVSKPTFDKWYTLLHGYVQKQQNTDSPIKRDV